MGGASVLCIHLYPTDMNQLTGRESGEERSASLRCLAKRE